MINDVNFKIIREQDVSIGVSRVMIDYRLFGIKPSSIISSICYSVFKLEPYTGCRYGCIYCYARWYRGPISVSSRDLLKYWRRIAEKLSRIDKPKPYFRLSTLTDPFQEGVEDKYLVSYRILETAYRYKIPVIINTKSTLLIREPWITILKKMSEEKLVLTQISLNTLKEAIALKLEPYAPNPVKRVEVIEKLNNEDIPVILRLQPLIPGLEDQHVEALKNTINNISGVITESIRLTLEDLKIIARIIGYDEEEYLRIYKWRRYSLEAENLYTPSDEWKKHIYKIVSGITTTHGIPYSTCKDKPLTPLRDCCLFWVTSNREYGVRETIREKILDIEKPNIKTITPDEYVYYPNPIRKILRLHRNKLEKILNDKEKLEWLIKTFVDHNNT